MAHADPNNFARHTEAVRRRLADCGMTRPGPGSVSWKVNREALAVAGWGRAILLQFTHPLVAEGVARHSNFSRGLAGIQRLRSTIGAMLSLTFGTDDEAIATAAGINSIHDRVAGRMESGTSTIAAGTRYSAHDPRLLSWVHATLLDSIPLTFERLVGPLTAEERERYCGEAAIMEPLMGIPPGSLPRTTAALNAYMARMFESDIAVTDTARALAKAVLYPPYGPLLWPALRPVRLLTIGLLPEPIREAYQFPWTPHDARALDRWCSTIGRMRRIVPAAAREWPVARRATRKAGSVRESNHQPDFIAEPIAPPSSPSRTARLSS